MAQEETKWVGLSKTVNITALASLVVYLLQKYAGLEVSTEELLAFFTVLAVILRLVLVSEKKTTLLPNKK